MNNNCNNYNRKSDYNCNYINKQNSNYSPQNKRNLQSGYYPSISHLPPLPPGHHYVMVYYPAPIPSNYSKPVYQLNHPPANDMKRPNTVAALFVGSVILCCTPAFPLGIAGLLTSGYLASRNGKTILPQTNFAATCWSLRTAFSRKSNFQVELENANRRNTN